MTTIATKTSNRLLPLSSLLSGCFSFILAPVILVTLISLGGISDGWLFNPFILGIIGIFMLVTVGGGIWLIREYRLWKRLPESLIETDYKYLYLHGKRSHKILLDKLDGSFIHGTPENNIINLVGDKYGTLSIELVNGKEYKVYFVANVGQIPETIARLIRGEEIYY